MANATVYQDSTNTYAKDPLGNVISTVSKSSFTDNIPINAAINAGTGVTFTGIGYYTINDYIRAANKTGFVVDFGGSTIKAGTTMGSNQSINYSPGKYGMFFIESSSNVELKNGTFDANMVPGSSGICVRGTNVVSNVTDIKITNTTVKNCGSWRIGTTETDYKGGVGIWTIGADRTVIDGCNIDNCAIGVNFAEYGTGSQWRYNSVINSNITNCTRQGLPSWTGMGVYIWGNNGSSITNCTFSGMTDYPAVWVGENRSGQDTFTMTDCEITDSFIGLNFGGEYLNNIISRCDFVHNTMAISHMNIGEISDCTFLNNGQGASIEREKSAISCDQGYTPSVDRILTVTRNVFEDNQPTPTQKYAYYHLSNAYCNNNKNGIVFTNNTLNRIACPLMVQSTITPCSLVISVTQSGNTNNNYVLNHNIVSSKINPIVNEPITVTTHVTNTGERTEKFHVVFSADGTEFYTSPVITISPGNTEMVSSQLIGDSPGASTVCADLLYDTVLYPAT
jgi:hypothetical protein